MIVGGMSLKPIGIFDSGVGGLTVMAAIRRELPQESLLYLGDTARVPYGNRSADTILRYTEECCTFLAQKEVKAIVIACNTASAHVFPYLQHRFHFPLLGVIEPGVKTALEKSRGKNIGVIGTRATIESGIYEKELKHLAPEARVKSVACPLFVPLIEEDWLEKEVTQAVAEEYLSDFATSDVDIIILGCTHYPLLKKVVAKVLGEKISLVDSAEALAQSLKNLLKERNLLVAKGALPSTKIYVTDLNPRFETVAKRFLGETLSSIQRVTL